MADVAGAGAKPLNVPPAFGFLSGRSSNFWFWTILAAGFICLQFVHNDIESDLGAGALSVAVIGSGIFLMQKFANVNAWPYLKAHWKMALICVIGYFILGGAFATGRYWRETAVWTRAYETELVHFKKEKGITSNDQLVGDVQKDWQRRYEHHPKIGPKMDPLSYSVQSQARRRVIAWPWSFTQWFLSDFVTMILDWIMNFLTNVLVAIDNWVTGDLPGIKR